jgi:hypothetical protein
MEEYIKHFAIGLRGRRSRREFPVDFIRENVARMKEFGSENILIWLLNNEFHVYSFMLLFPEVWMDFHKVNWQQILVRAKRPANLRLLMDERGYFDDIIFLYRFVEVDSLKWVYEDPILSRENKLNIFNYFLERPDHLFRDNWDSENFQNGNWPEFGFCMRMKRRLISEGFQEVHQSVLEDEQLWEKCQTLVILLEARIKTLQSA